MDKVLPIAAVQAAPFALSEPLAHFADSVSGVMRSFSQTRLVVYPELHLFGGAGPEEWQTSAEPLDGPRLRTLAQLAGDLGVWLVPGSVCERGPDGQLFNTAVVFSPTGQLAASYGFRLNNRQ